MGIIDLIVAALATWQALEIWHHSSIMASWRARTELWGGRLGELTRCMFCMSPWAAAAVLILSGWWSWPGESLTRLAVWALAVARLANLGNDLGYAICRTPRHNRMLPEPLDASEAAVPSLNPELGDLDASADNTRSA